MASMRLFQIFMWLCLFPFYFSNAEAKCTGCKVALGSFYVTQGINITYILTHFNDVVTSETLKTWKNGVINNDNFIYLALGSGFPSHAIAWVREITGTWDIYFSIT